MKTSLKALRERPEWLEELRRIILTEELISLPQRFEIFIQKDFRPLKEKVEKIELDTETLKQDVAELKGDNFERKVRKRVPSYFGKLIKRCKVVSLEELAEILENAVENFLIKEEEKDEVLNIDIVATGVLKKEEKKVVLVGEVSIKADRDDVERAYKSAGMISRAMGVSSIAVVVGKESTEGAIKNADEIGVILF